MYKKSSLPKVLSLVFLFLLGLSWWYIVWDKYQEKNSHNIGVEHVYSHRGASGEEIEHTFEAYDLAISYGSQYIEQDLVTSKDKTLYVSHDLNAKRLTGEDKKYGEMTDDEIDKLKTKNAEKIHRLRDVFVRYQDTVTYVIELKGEDEQIELFKEEVQQAKLKDKIIVQSFKVKTLEKLNETFPKMKKLLLVKDQKTLDQTIKHSVVDIFGVSKKLMTEENIENIHKNKKTVSVWTLNRSDDIKKAINLNVDTYFTNFTGKALVLEKENRKTNRE
ncbi:MULTISPECIES: glycerophosphodiester phosphodiesterase [Vagococcus]|uniref:Glycerophosphoryl diester phosphodiesterase, phage variant n=1 Tax=Vagococcus fluvialis bH819 TaxID=1255619 RepID=A0A1X6WMF7_9ENTE|nr:MULTISPECIES: glycerophosphodiester phosphodiesterase [Vagococcus]SLM85449.1 Glycerophosphoryl diester phosphodiesterase, phage variant [Vagococcus fluvialis bH819]HCM89258.1 glycerophosphodiester phosphodiesterase [Vagococcus sp.]